MADHKELRKEINRLKRENKKLKGKTEKLNKRLSSHKESIALRTSEQDRFIRETEKVLSKLKRKLNIHLAASNSEITKFEKFIDDFTAW